MLYIGLNRGKISNLNNKELFQKYFDTKLNKYDVIIGEIADSYNFETLEEFKKQLNVEVIPISAFTRENLNELIYKVADKLDEVKLIPDPIIETEVVEYKFKEEADQEAVWDNLSKALELASLNLSAMREKEGDKLKEELLAILKVSEGYYNNICERSPFVPAEYKEKLNQRLAELLEKGIVDEQRVAAEVAVFADKCSIDEEIARFSSHVKQFKDALQCGGSVGRRLDFIVQEMNREVNTMGSKANDIVITNNVIALKSEIEKIREQIQNLE